MMFPQIRFSFAAESFPAFYTEVTFVYISDPSEGFDRIVEQIIVFYHDVDINNRFRRKPGN